MLVLAQGGKGRLLLYHVDIWISQLYVSPIQVSHLPLGQMLEKLVALPETGLKEELVKILFDIHSELPCCLL